MVQIFEELGPTYVRRAYRMDENSFWKLHRLLYPFLRYNVNPSSESTKKNRNGANNGLISSPTRLSAALRYFAGGAPVDIAIAHGIAHSEVYTSIWMVVDAVNKCDALKIEFPEDHEKQKAIAEGFEKKSEAGFKICCGAIDCMLLWLEKPTKEECDQAKCSERKFYCGRKKKFGLQFQAVCDHNNKFLDVSMKHPGATSDFLAFSTSTLFLDKLDKEGFLAPGLCLFGDNAYVNAPFMATPFKGVSSGSKDAYNFFHSQLRINIECAFGMLVNRWGLLRRAMPSRIGLYKVTRLVTCLCRLHNFCIDRRLEEAGSCPIAPLLAIDEAEIEVNGGVPLGGDENVPPDQLVGGGHHFDDFTRNERQAWCREYQNCKLPHEILHDIIVDLDLQRPTPAQFV